VLARQTKCAVRGGTAVNAALPPTIEAIVKSLIYIDAEAGIMQFATRRGTLRT
jgi:hypothetical protein